MRSTTASPEVCTSVSDSIIKKLALPVPSVLPRRILALNQLDDLWARVSLLTGPYFERFLTALGVECVCDEADLRLIPRTGPAIVMANHPHGILDGMLAASLLARVRPDVKIVSNSMITHLPEM